MSSASLTLWFGLFLYSIFSSSGPTVRWAIVVAKRPYSVRHPSTIHIKCCFFISWWISIYDRDPFWKWLSWPWEGIPITTGANRSNLFQWSHTCPSEVDHVPVKTRLVPVKYGSKLGREAHCWPRKGYILTQRGMEGICGRNIRVGLYLGNFLSIFLIFHCLFFSQEAAQFAHHHLR